MIAQNEHITIRKATEHDSAFFLELLTSKSWKRYIGASGVITEKGATSYIKRALLRSYEQHGFGLYLVEDAHGVAIGICGFVQRSYLDAPDLGFAFLPQAQGKGYAKKAAQLCMEYALNGLLLNTVYGITTPNNKASIQVLKHAGLQYNKMVQEPETEKEFMLFEWNNNSNSDD